MEMCYNETLVMPSSYIAMDENEMQYIEGGDGLREKAEGFIYGVLAAGIGAIAKKAISASMVRVVAGLCGAWIVSTVDAAIVTAMFNPALATTCVLAAAAGIFAVGVNLGYF